MVPAQMVKGLQSTEDVIAQSRKLHFTHTLHGTGIYVYIDSPNHPNVGIYDNPMECMG